MARKQERMISIKKAEQILEYAAELIGTGNYYSQTELKYPIELIQYATLVETERLIKNDKKLFKENKRAFESIYIGSEDRIVADQNLASELNQGGKISDSLDMMLEKTPGEGGVFEGDIDERRIELESKLDENDKKSLKKFEEWSSRSYSDKLYEYSNFVKDCEDNQIERSKVLAPLEKLLFEGGKATTPVSLSPKPKKTQEKPRMGIDVSGRFIFLFSVAIMAGLFIGGVFYFASGLLAQAIGISIPEEATYIVAGVVGITTFTWLYMSEKKGRI